MTGSIFHTSQGANKLSAGHFLYFKYDPLQNNLIIAVGTADGLDAGGGSDVDG